MNALLVAVDGSEGSRRAAAFAGNLARTSGADLTVLYVVEPLSEAIARGMRHSTDGLKENLLLEGQQVLSEFCQDLGLPEADQVIEFGRAPETICAEAHERKVDMIVVGAGGHGPRRLAPGSVASRLLDMADRTVTVVR